MVKLETNSLQNTEKNIEQKSNENIKKKVHPFIISKESYNKIYSTSRKLLLQHGIHRISVEEICRESGVSRMTFYKEFKNKKELALLIFDEEEREHAQRLEKLLSEKKPYPEVIETFLLLDVHLNKELGDIFIKDIMSDPETLDQIRQNMLIDSESNWRLKLFQHAKEAGHVRDEIDEISYIYFLESLTILFSRLVTLERFSKHTEKLTSLIVNVMLYGVFKPQTTNKEKE